MYLDISGRKGPLCPNQLDPIHPMHRFHTELIDAAYKAGNVDKDTLEFSTTEATNVYIAIAHKQYDGYMNLYRDAVSTIINRSIVFVETFYFRCSICGLVLPANRGE